MILFVVYAVFIWYASFRYRRSLAGVGVFIAGLTGVALVGAFHYQLNEWTDGQIYLPVLQVLLYPYAGLVAFISAYLWIMPRPHAEDHCGSCGYNLRGLEAEQPTCPECGLPATTSLTTSSLVKEPATYAVETRPSGDAALELDGSSKHLPAAQAKVKVTRFTRG